MSADDGVPGSERLAMEDFNYERAEINRALEGMAEDSSLRLKIVGDNGKSRWLSVSPAQVRRVRDVLGGDVLTVTDLGRALAAQARALASLEARVAELACCSQCRPGHAGPDGLCMRHGKRVAGCECECEWCVVP